jgi:branched-chain amino acid transport system ATP-binding protein
VVILEATNIKKYYGDFCALAGVDIRIHEGEFMSVIGPNGAGKTTLINCLTGFLKPDSGQVKFKGQDIAGMGPEKLSKMGIARSFQLVNIFPDLSLIDTLKVAIISREGKGGKLFANLSKDKAVHQQALEIAELFGLSDRLNETSKNCPQGIKKLLDVASAFALHPEIILLDEPTSGVSTSDKNRIMEVLLDASEKIGIKTILQVEHDMDIVFSYSDRIIAVQQGKILADGLPEEIEKNEDVICNVVGQKECFQTFSRIMDAAR